MRVRIEVELLVPKMLYEVSVLDGAGDAFIRGSGTDIGLALRAAAANAAVGDHPLRGVGECAIAALLEMSAPTCADPTVLS
jgi:hypothetical protein